jgi:hypothetical protein
MARPIILLADLQRLCAAARRDPRTLLDQHSYTARALCYLAMVSPYSRRNQAIQHAIGYQDTGRKHCGALLAALVKRGVVVRLGHQYRLAGHLLALAPHAQEDMARG